MEELEQNLRPEEIAVTWKTREVSSVNRLMAPPSPANHDGHRSTDQLFSSTDPGVKLNCGLAAPCDQNRLEAGPRHLEHSQPHLQTLLKSREAAFTCFCLHQVDKLAVRLSYYWDVNISGYCS